MPDIPRQPSACLNCGVVPDAGARFGLCANCLVQQMLGRPDPVDSTPAFERLPGDAPHYELEGELAHGGMGRIMRARDATLDRRVAMKVMLPNAGATGDGYKRFLREAVVLARLEHPNIVPIHDLGRDAQGDPFYTMKLVKGVTLQEVLDGLAAEDNETLANFPLHRLLTIFQKVCDAIAFAHARGVIHRDLKPLNIMVAEFGEVLVMDWGLAKILDGSAKDDTASPDGISPPVDNSDLQGEPLALSSRPDLTRNGSVMGTPNYMSPEQAEGRFSEMDERSDVFALGGILYALLTLRPPVEGATAEEVLMKARKGDITRPGTTRRGSGSTGPRRQRAPAESSNQGRTLPHLPAGQAPEALTAVAMKALALRREERYASATELAADVEAFQGGFPTSAEKAGLLTQLRLLVKRHRREFAIGFAAWLLITSLAIWFVVNLQIKERRSQAEALRARRFEAAAVQDKETAREALAQSSVSLAEAFLREGNGPEMQLALNRVPTHLRDSSWNYLFQQSDTAVARTAHEIVNAAPDLRQAGIFALADLSRQITVLNVRTGAKLLEFSAAFPREHDIKRLRLAISPDGERIAVGAEFGDRLVLHRTRDGIKMLEWAATGTTRLEFSADGRLLLQTDKGGRQLFAWDAATGKLLWDYASTQGVSGRLTPDGQQVLTYSSQDLFRLVKAQDGSLIRRLGGVQSSVMVMAIHPDGRMAVTASREDRILRGVDLGNGRVLFASRPHEEFCRHLDFTSDGTRFVSVTLLADRRQAIQIWDAKTGRPLQSLLGGRGAMEGARLHPLNDELLVYAPGINTLWDLTGMKSQWVFRAGRDASAGLAQSDAPAVSPATEDVQPRGRRRDGGFWGEDDLLFASDGMNGLGLLHLTGDQPSTLWKPPHTAYRQFSLSGDGRFAALGAPGTVLPIIVLRRSALQPETVASIEMSYHVDGLHLSPTGEHLAVFKVREPTAPPGSDPKKLNITRYGLELFDTATGRKISSPERDDVFMFNAIGWLASGRHLVGLVTAVDRRGTPDSEERVVLWDVNTGKVVQYATNRTPMEVLAVAPDGNRFAEAGIDKKVRVRDSQTLAVIREFRAHDGEITALAWHPIQPTLATGSSDLCIRLWDLDSGRRLEELRGPVAAPIELAFSRGGRRLVCVDRDNVTRIWNTPSLSPSPGTNRP